MKRGLFSVAILLAVLFESAAVAEYPPSVNMAQQMPPTEADWYRLYLRRYQRRAGIDCMAVEPILLYGEILYYPCPPEQPCGEPLHRSFKGVYGIRHPMPYYIPAHRIEVALPENCPECLSRKTQPIPRNPSPVVSSMRD